MKKGHIHTLLKNPLIFMGLFVAAFALSYLLSLIFDDNNPFATPVYILAVALVARFTSGYIWGIAAAFAGVFLVNFVFSYPFFEFDFSISGYPLTFTVMLVVSILISTLTTRLKTAEQIRYDAEKEKLRADLLRAVSHDIRTPLASILGSSSALVENPTFPEKDRIQLLDEIQYNAQWLVRMTENLLSVTKFSGENVRLKKTDEVVEEIIGSAIVKFRKNYKNLPIYVSRPDEILLVPMDATLIEQVLLNLFENAAVHGLTTREISVSFHQNGNRAEFSVADDGKGIPRELLPKIFNGCANTTRNSDSSNGRHMGIGLSVCNSIIRAHGGEMSAYNNIEGGACFHFWLPMEGCK